jgi:hypothetical protein
MALRATKGDEEALSGGAGPRPARASQARKCLSATASSASKPFFSQSRQGASSPISSEFFRSWLRSGRGRYFGSVKAYSMLPPPTTTYCRPSNS